MKDKIFAICLVASLGFSFLGGVVVGAMSNKLTDTIWKTEVSPFNQEALGTYPAEQTTTTTFKGYSEDIPLCEAIGDETGWHANTPCRIPAEKNKYYCDPNFEIDCHGSGVNFKSTEKPLEYPLESEGNLNLGFQGAVSRLKTPDGDYICTDGFVLCVKDEKLKELYQLLKSKYE